MKRFQIKALVIDDDKAILKALFKRLSRMGIEADVAETVAEGIDKINSNPYDLIFTDIKMPGMSGNDVFRYVKNNLSKLIPIIAMSGTPWLLEHSDFDAVIAKPFLKEELFEVVSQFAEIPYDNCQ